MVRGVPTRLFPFAAVRHESGHLLRFLPDLLEGVKGVGPVESLMARAPLNGEGLAQGRFTGLRRRVVHRGFGGCESFTITVAKDVDDI